MTETDSERYTAELSASGSTVTAQIEETNEDADAGRAGTFILEYDGPETPGSLPEVVGEQRFYHAAGIDEGDDGGAQVNVAGGINVEFDVSEEYIGGDGVFSLHHDSDDVPLARVSAGEARGEDNTAAVTPTKLTTVREQLAKERARNDRQDEAIAELRSELDDVEQASATSPPDGGTVVAEEGGEAAGSAARAILASVLRAFGKR